jgi:uncharacterized membrane protein YqjE
MADQLGTTPEPSLSSLVSGIIQDAQTLLRQELTLARVEIKEELLKARDLAIAVGAGAGLVLGGVVLLVLMVVFLLTWATGGAIPLWGSFGIVGGLMIVTGACFFLIGKHYAEKLRLNLPQTTATMQENMQWIQNQR